MTKRTEGPWKWEQNDECTRQGGRGKGMINNERLESLRRGREVLKFAMEAQKERGRIIPFFRDFMESAYWNIPETPDGCDEVPKFTRTDMFRAFMYGAREAGHLYWKQEKGEGDATVGT